MYLLFTKGRDGVPIACVLLQVTMCPCSRGRASIFAGPDRPARGRSDAVTDLRETANPGVLHKKAMVPAVAQMSPAYAEGGGGAESLLGPYDV